MAGPEEGFINGVGLELAIVTFKSPYFLSILVEVIPPSQTNKQSSGYVLDRPEIKRGEKDHDDESVDIREEIAKDEVA